MSHRGSDQKSGGTEAGCLAQVLHDCLGSGILILGDQEEILCCTPEAERLLHLPPGGTVGCGLSALPPAIQKVAREAASSHKAVEGRTIAIAAEKDSPTFRVGAYLFRSCEGRVQTVVTINDIAVVLRMEQNLKRLDRLASIGTLSAGLAHEIRNALVASKTFVDLLLDKNQDDELAGVVRREMKRIDSIVSQMLRFGAPTRPALASLRLHDVLEHSLRMLQHQFDGKLISLHRNFTAPHDVIKGDDYQLEQAFLNLFLNALDAMGPNGALTVATELLDGASSAPERNGQHRQLRVTVADNGIGIDHANLGRLFEPFFTTKQNGTGLGLAITRRIIHEHQGEISVQSQPSQGTTFSILLPTHTRS